MQLNLNNPDTNFKRVEENPDKYSAHSRTICQFDVRNAQFKSVFLYLEGDYVCTSKPGILLSRKFVLTSSRDRSTYVFKMDNFKLQLFREERNDLLAAVKALIDLADQTAVEKEHEQARTDATNTIRSVMIASSSRLGLPARHVSTTGNAHTDNEITRLKYEILDLLARAENETDETKNGELRVKIASLTQEWAKLCLNPDSIAKPQTGAIWEPKKKGFYRKFTHIMITDISNFVCIETYQTPSEPAAVKSMKVEMNPKPSPMEFGHEDVLSLEEEARVHQEAMKLREVPSTPEAYMKMVEEFQEKLQKKRRQEGN